MNKFNSDINPKNYYGEALELTDDDKRLEEFQKQRLERGFDESEIWSIDYLIISFALPRIKRLLEIEKGFHYPYQTQRSLLISEESLADSECKEYMEDLEQIVKDLEEYDPIKTDLTLFFKRFKQLWY